MSVVGGLCAVVAHDLIEPTHERPQILRVDGLTGSLMDYGLPRADEVPDMAIEYYEGAPTAKNPLGVKGAGEAGCVGSLPAVVNAVLDALKEDGVRHIDMPLTPEKVWRAIRDHGAVDPAGLMGDVV